MWLFMKWDFRNGTMVKHSVNRTAQDQAVVSGKLEIQVPFTCIILHLDAVVFVRISP